MHGRRDGGAAARRTGPAVESGLEAAVAGEFGVGGLGAGGEREESTGGEGARQYQGEGSGAGHNCLRGKGDRRVIEGRSGGGGIEGSAAQHGPDQSSGQDLCTDDASVRVDVRGHGNSEGLPGDEYDATELADGVAVVHWLAEQPW
ncbi:hypothetical protein EF906_30180, partial [Streptomyces sp. WAC08241]